MSEKVTPAPTPEKPVELPTQDPVTSSTPSAKDHHPNHARSQKPAAPGIPTVALSASPAPQSEAAQKPVEQSASSEASPVVLHEYGKSVKFDNQELRGYKLVGSKHQTVTNSVDPDTKQVISKVVNHTEGDTVQLTRAQFEAFKDKFLELDEAEDYYRGENDPESRGPLGNKAPKASKSTMGANIDRPASTLPAGSGSAKI